MIICYVLLVIAIYCDDKCHVCVYSPDEVLHRMIFPWLRARRWAACCTPYGPTCGWQGCRCNRQLIGFRENSTGNYRKPWFLPSTMGLSGKISHPILWNWGRSSLSNWDDIQLDKARYQRFYSSEVYYIGIPESELAKKKQCSAECRSQFSSTVLDMNCSVNWPKETSRNISGGASCRVTYCQSLQCKTRKFLSWQLGADRSFRHGADRGCTLRCPATTQDPS